MEKLRMKSGILSHFLTFFTALIALLRAFCFAVDLVNGYRLLIFKRGREYHESCCMEVNYFVYRCGKHVFLIFFLQACLFLV